MKGARRWRLFVALALAVCAPGVARADRVDELVQSLLGDSSYKVRTQAAIVLGKLGDQRAVAGLVEALKDESDAVRGAAASSLGKLGDPSCTGALGGLRNDASSFVRDAVAKSLALLEHPATPGKPPPGRAAPGAHFYIAVDVPASAKASEDAARALREALSGEIAKLPLVTTTLDAAPTPSALAARKLSGFTLRGNITRLKLTGDELDCDVALTIVTIGAQQILRATATASAGVPGVTNPADASATRDCLGGAAQALAEDVGKFLRAQK